jgi:hypothetical protein
MYVLTEYHSLLGDLLGCVLGHLTGLETPARTENYHSLDTETRTASLGIQAENNSVINSVVLFYLLAVLCMLNHAGVKSSS